MGGEGNRVIKEGERKREGGGGRRTKLPPVVGHVRFLGVWKLTREYFILIFFNLLFFFFSLSSSLSPLIIIT